MHSKVADTDERYAGSETSEAVLIPRPPIRTGKEHCSQLGSSIPTFKMLIKATLKALSYFFKISVFLKQGLVLKKYVSFGKEKACLSRKRASCTYVIFFFQSLQVTQFILHSEVFHYGKNLREMENKVATNSYVSNT